MKLTRAGQLGLAAIVMTLAAGCTSSVTTGATTSSGTATSPAVGASTTAHTTMPAAHKATAKVTSHAAVVPVVSSAPTATQAAAPQTTAPPQAGCYPLTNGGNCYKSGEFCRSTDHGVTGVNGNGAAIKCEYNNGWRWEPI